MNILSEIMNCVLVILCIWQAFKISDYRRLCNDQAKLIGRMMKREKA